MEPLLLPITYKCNLKCKFCKERDKNKDPDIIKTLELVRDAPEEWVFLTGGEPLMLSNIELICNIIKSLGKKVGITTNGTIHNDRIHLFADRVGVSIDGNKQYHDKYRDNSFDSATYYLKSIIGKVHTVIMFTLFEENKHLENWIRAYYEAVGADDLQITKGIV